MSPKVKLIRTVYLYLAALVSLLFVAIGAGTVLNTGLKYAFFPEAEKKSFYECNQQPPVYALEAGQLKGAATEDQKKQLDMLLRDYDNWKENSQGDKCIVPARQNKLIDAITMILVALPICLLHWRIIKQEKEEKEEEITG